MNTVETPANARQTRALWISAAALAVVALLQLGLPAGPPAIAAPAPGDVATNGDYTMLTLTHSNEDLLFLLDGRNETLSIYHVKNQSIFEPLLLSGDLKTLFNEGRRRGAGGK